jgi:hypothetical protein
MKESDARKNRVDYQFEDENENLWNVIAESEESVRIEAGEDFPAPAGGPGTKHNIIIFNQERTIKVSCYVESLSTEDFDKLRSELEKVTEVAQADEEALAEPDTSHSEDEEAMVASGAETGEDGEAIATSNADPGEDNEVIATPSADPDGNEENTQPEIFIIIELVDNKIGGPVRINFEIDPPIAANGSDSYQIKLGNGNAYAKVRVTTGASKVSGTLSPSDGTAISNSGSDFELTSANHSTAQWNLTISGLDTATTYTLSGSIDKA